jgi:iron(III) transport system permease protein
MDDAGDIAPAAAMAIMILLTNAAVYVVYTGLTRGVQARTQAWRKR